jgi:hypothetical protein
MKFAPVVNTEADKVWVNVLNVQAVSVTDGECVVWDVVSPDGVRVSQPATATLGLTVGLVDGTIEASAYGLAQVYGYKSTGSYSTDTITGTAGDCLAPTAAQDYLTDVAPGGASAYVAVAGGQHSSFFYAAESRTDTITLGATKVFIRAM